MNLRKKVKHLKKHKENTELLIGTVERIITNYLSKQEPLTDEQKYHIRNYIRAKTECYTSIRFILRSSWFLDGDEPYTSRLAYKYGIEKMAKRYLDKWFSHLTMFTQQIGL